MSTDSDLANQRAVERERRIIEVLVSLDDFSADYLRVCANFDRRGHSLKGARQLSVTFIILNIGDGSRAER